MNRGGTIKPVGAGAAWSMGEDACVAPVLFAYHIPPLLPGISHGKLTEGWTDFALKDGN